jgi:hypothetical protein
MSVTGNAHKFSGDIKSAINAIAKKGITDPNGAIRGTQKIIGYVCAIHEDGELAGTIDVQEYNFEPDEYMSEGTRHHKGVLLSAIQENEEGVWIVPMMFSDVMIVENPTDGHEYVIMYSHAKKIQWKAHEDIEIGVTEVEDFVETDDGLDKDYNELEPTGNKTSTHYSSLSIIDKVVSKDDEQGFIEEKTANHKVITVGDTKITIDGQNVTIETSGKVSVKSNNVNVECSNCDVKGDNIKVNGSNVEITGGTLKTKGQSNTDLQGPFNAIKVCPFSGAPHCGSTVSGT